MTKTFYAIRSGYNSANQSSAGRSRNPKNNFESGLYALVGIVNAGSENEACESVQANCYSGQRLFATSNPRSVKGLMREICGVTN